MMKKGLLVTAVLLLLRDYFRERYHGTAAIELFT